MTNRRITIIDGHPDPDPARFVHALADHYADGAAAAGREVRRVTLSALEFSWLRSRQDWEGAYVDFDIRRSQEAIRWADHIVLLYPLWLGDMPALLKAFFEQALRPGFAFEPRPGKGPRKALKGRSARIVVTMGMPALVYRAYYGAHSVKSLERNILKFTGIGPVDHMIVGDVEGSAEARQEWLDRLRLLGETGQ